jgi:methionine-rich copper-binding protein CopC
MKVLIGARGFVLALIAWMFGAGVALGHSGLQRAEPPVESKLKRPPSEVKLYFSERLEHDYSTVRVNDAAGARVDRQDAHVDPSNPLLLRVTLQPLEHGAYTVIWRVLSVDSHVTEGRFTFRVE